MSTKTQKQTQRELDKIQFKEDVLKEANDKYAIKLVEKIVFGFLILLGAAVAAKLFYLLGLSATPIPPTS